MRKFLIFLIIIGLTSFQASVFGKNSGRIEDEILNSGVILSQKNSLKKLNNSPIYDELLNPSLYEKAPFKLGVYKNQKNSIEDELINSDFISNADALPIKKIEIPDEFFIEKITDVSKTRKIKPKTKYDFTKQQIPIRIRIAKHLKTTKETMEGADIPFVSEDDFEIKGKKFPKGTTILGRVETISDSDKMGTPECIKIDNFYIAGDETINLHGSVSKMGANRSIWVYPLYQAGNICFYVAGFVFVPIHGGRAKLLTSESFTVYYETQ